MEIYSERLSRLVGHIPPEMLPLLPDVVVECIRLHGAQPGAALRNRSEAAFLRWMCSQIEKLMAKKAHSRECKRPDGKPRRPPEMQRERKGIYRTHGYEQKPITPPHMRHSLEETKELIKEKVDQMNGNNRKTFASHIHQSLNENGDLMKVDNHRMQDSPMESKERRRERKGVDERNGRSHMHSSVKEKKESGKVEDTNGKKRNPLTDHMYDHLSETEDFMEVDKTSRNNQKAHDSYTYDSLKETTEFIGVESTKGNNGKSLTSNMCDNREESTEVLTFENQKRNQHLATYMHDSLDETKEVMTFENTCGIKNYVAQMGDQLESTKKLIRAEKTNGNNHFASHMGDNLEETKEPKSVQNTNRNNCLASLMGDSLKDSMDLKIIENTNGNNHKPHKSQIHHSLRENKEFIRERKGVERRNRNNHTYNSLEDRTELIGGDKTCGTHRNSLASPTDDSFGETKELIREQKGHNKRNGKKNLDNFKETKDLKVEKTNGNHQKPALSYIRDSLKETKALTRVDKTNGNHRKPAQSHMRDILNETKDIKLDRTTGNLRKSIPSHTHKNLKGTEKMLGRVGIVTSRKDDDGCEAKKRRGPGRSNPSPRTIHSREKTPKRKHRMSPENVSTSQFPSYPIKSVFTYLSLIETDDNGVSNTRYDWAPTTAVSHRTTHDAKEQSHSRGSKSKRTTKDWKTVGSYTYQNLKSDKIKPERLGAVMRMAYDRKPVIGSCVNVTKVKDKTRSSWKPIGPYQNTKNMPKHVHFLLESVRV